MKNLIIIYFSQSPCYFNCQCTVHYILCVEIRPSCFNPSIVSEYARIPLVLFAVLPTISILLRSYLSDDACLRNFKSLARRILGFLRDLKTSVFLHTHTHRLRVVCNSASKKTVPSSCSLFREKLSCIQGDSEVPETRKNPELTLRRKNDF